MASVKPQYDNTSISSLKGADRVRKRPGVIFGSDGLDGCQHAVFEILSNAIDEAREGQGSPQNIPPPLCRAGAGGGPQTPRAALSPPPNQGWLCDQSERSDQSRGSGAGSGAGAAAAGTACTGVGRRSGVRK